MGSMVGARVMAVVTAKMIKSAKAVNVVGYAQQLLR